MTHSEVSALNMLVGQVTEIRKDQREHGETLALVRDTTDRTEQAVGVLQSEMLTVQGQARKALALHDASDKATAQRQAAMDGDTSAAGWFWYSTPQTLALRFPRVAVSLLGLSIAMPAALALGLAWFAGPGGGLRILLQQAGIKTVMVPTPSPDPPPVSAVGGS